MMVPSRLQNVVITPQNNMYFAFPREELRFGAFSISSHIPQVSDIPQFSNLFSTTIKVLFKIILRMREPLAILFRRETFLVQSRTREH